jgi:hypothetical protein
MAVRTVPHPEVEITDLLGASPGTGYCAQVTMARISRPIATSPAVQGTIPPELVIFWRNRGHQLHADRRLVTVG